MTDSRRDFPWPTAVDIVGTLVLAALGTLVAVFDVRQLLPLRFVLGVFLALFAPGYAVVATLFPRTIDRSEDTPPLLTRFVLSIAISVAVVPLVVLAIQYGELDIQPSTVAPSLFGVTCMFAVFALIRRRRLPAQQRFTIAGVHRTEFSPFGGSNNSSLLEKGLYALVAISLIGMISGAAVGLVSSPQSGPTELYLLAPDRTGELAANEYPTQLAVNESTPLTVGIHNQDGTARKYTVDVTLQQVTERETAPTVTDETPVDRFSVQLDDTQRTTHTVDVTPRRAGGTQRVLFELYRGTETSSNSYRTVYLWIDVSTYSGGQD